MPGGDRTTGPRRRGRVASGILTAQLLISGPILVVVLAAVIVQPEIYLQPILVGGVAFFFVLTGVAALVPWDAVHRNWGRILPFLNLAGIILLREFAPLTGIGLLVILPIIWIARTFSRTLTIVGAAGTILLLIFDVTPSAGPAYTLLAFVIVITGGLGSMPGALVGGVLIGLTEAMAGLLFTPSAKSMFSFAILVLVLLLRPQGIMGRRLA